MGARELRMAAQLTQEQVAELICAVEQLGNLIGDSRGVIGLHLNGDVADWDWLLGTWLDAFEPANTPLVELHAAEMTRLERLKNARFTGKAAAQ